VEELRRSSCLGRPGHRRLT